jgi:hypothetical protein
MDTLDTSLSFVVDSYQVRGSPEFIRLLDLEIVSATEREKALTDALLGSLGSIKTDSETRTVLAANSGVTP